MSSRAAAQALLDLFRRAGADPAITDMVMPDTEGVEVLRELRRTHAPVKIIAMSGAARGAAYLEVARLLGGEGAREAVSDRGAARGG